MNEEKQFSQASREQVLIDVRRFAHKQIDVPENKISEQTALQKDLRLEGDDADEFMLAYSERFQVNLGDFNFTEYFDVEGGFNPVYFVYLWLIKPNRLKKKAITLSNLVDAAITHKWS